VTIAEALDAEAAELDGVERRASSGGIEWAAAGVTFAALAGDIAEFRLSPVVASAARGTPDAGPSVRGNQWVAFSPPALDRYARDRAVAWFGSAYRAAVAGKGPESKRPR
jgi:hypothetical protein